MVPFISLPSVQRSKASRHALIYFICGNPGLVEYYTDFFNFLRKLIDDNPGEKPSISYDIYGRNLLGFADEEHEPFGDANKPYVLEDEICGMYDDLAARRRATTDGSGPKPYDFVIVMGHSVGAFIAVEIFHRHMRDRGKAPHLHLRHGFLLFPTLTDIAKSPAGVRLSFVTGLPLLGDDGHKYARFFLTYAPQSAVYWIVSTLMGFSQQAASITSKWLASKDGLWQALYLGKSELAGILQDRWDEKLWEVPEEYEDHYRGASKFYFFYAKEDHWVANDLRDKFIETRRDHGKRGGSTNVEIYEGKVNHAFCTTQESSLLIARKVHSWVKEIGQLQGGTDTAA